MFTLHHRCSRLALVIIAASPFLAQATITIHKPLRYTLNGTIVQLELRNDFKEPITITSISPQKPSTILLPGHTVELDSHIPRGYFHELAKLFNKGYATSYLTMNTGNTHYRVKFENTNISLGYCQALVLNASDIIKKGIPYQPSPSSPASIHHR